MQPRGDCSSGVPVEVNADEEKIEFGSDLFFGVHCFCCVSQSEYHSPSSVCFGRFQRLTRLCHDNICRYIDLLPGKRDHLFVISEHYSNNLEKVLSHTYALNGCGFSEEVVARYAYQLLQALAYLHSEGIVCRNMALDSILLDGQGNIKLADYGLFYLTEWGKHVAFAIGEPHYLAPEVIAGGVQCSPSPESDIWALGIVLVALICGQLPWAGETDPRSVLAKITFLVGHSTSSEFVSCDCSNFSDKSALEQRQLVLWFPLFDRVRRNLPRVKTRTNGNPRNQLLLQSRTQPTRSSLFAQGKERVAQWLQTDHRSPAMQRLSPEFKNFLLQCLEVSLTSRPSSQELVRHSYFSSIGLSLPNQFLFSVSRKWVRKPVLHRYLNLDCDLPLESCANEDPKESVFKYSEATSCRHSLSLKEIYHLWHMLGNNVETSVNIDLQISPPIHRIPRVLRQDSESSSCFGTRKAFRCLADSSSLYDRRHFVISLDALRARLLATHHAVPTTSGSSRLSGISAPVKLDSLGPEYSLLLEEGQKLQAAIPRIDERNDNIEYQHYRVKIFRVLLWLWQSVGSRTVREEMILQANPMNGGIPALLRGEIWAVVLGVRDHECQAIYDSIEKIELDVHRCHQYSQLLSSPEAQTKMKNVLKAWVAANPGLAYWQGIDSVLAPFIVLHFLEAKAFCCLQKFVDTHLRQFFYLDNSQYLKNYLLTFRQLLAFHDPALAMHLHHIGFDPNLYVIPWFLTAFTHVFSLDKIFLLWDKLLLLPPSYPFFVALDILTQLRGFILPLDFDGCIALFSNLPEIDFELCITEAESLSETTPLTITVKQEAKTAVSDVRWWDQPIPFERRIKEYAPRISLQDFVLAAETGIVLDLRPSSEFNLLHYPGAINLPQNSRSPEKDWQLFCLQLEQFRGRKLILIGDACCYPQFANQLVEDLFPHVCVLNGGIDCLRADAGPLLEGTKAQTF